MCESVGVGAPFRLCLIPIVFTLYWQHRIKINAFSILNLLSSLRCQWELKAAAHMRQRTKPQGTSFLHKTYNVLQSMGTSGLRSVARLLLSLVGLRVTEVEALTLWGNVKVNVNATKCQCRPKIMSATVTLTVKRHCHSSAHTAYG